MRVMNAELENCSQRIFSKGQFNCMEDYRTHRTQHSPQFTV